jgi:hypothetical protein
MKSKNKYNEKPSAAWSPNLTIKSVAIIALSWLGFQTSVQGTRNSKVKYTKPSWYWCSGWC